MKQKQVWIPTILFLILFCISGSMLLSHFLTGWQEEKAFQKIAQQILQNSSHASDQNTSAPLTTEDGILLEYASLYGQNPDLFGWIALEGTELNYPVMYTPNDPEHYLRRAFDGTSTLSGTPFLDARCSAGCGNYILYGHNMNNGTMFAGLLSYADKKFWQEHPVIRFDTLYEKGEYTVLAAFYSEVCPEDAEGAFRYYNYTDLREKAVFEDYLRQVKSAALYDTGVGAEHGDQLLTLSTCSYHAENGRFVVVAKKIGGGTSQ